MRCFVVAGFLLTSASRGPSAIAEALVYIAEVVLTYCQVSIDCVVYCFMPYFASLKGWAQAILKFKNLLKLQSLQEDIGLSTM